VITEAWAAIFVCIAALAATLFLARRGGGSLGMPVAYMIGLLLIHVPGAFAFVISKGAYSGSLSGGGGDYVAEGIILTAAGCAIFPVGVWLGRRFAKLPRGFTAGADLVGRNFLRFCLIGGWLLAFGLGFLERVPSVGATIAYGSSIWMLSVMLALDDALAERNFRRVLLQMIILMVYPVEVLLFGGFLSYGSAAVILVLSFILVRMRSFWRAMIVIAALFYVGTSIFVGYYGARDDLRSVIWSNAGSQERVAAVQSAFAKLRPFDPHDPQHLRALDERLNQNEFVGLAAARIRTGEVNFLHGRSISEGLMALVPRAVWPSKPVFGGSPKVVSEMTGLKLNENTSFGVGNVMEFYINFGTPSLLAGFLLLGAVIGGLDIRAYQLIRAGRPADAILFFLPCVALIQPNGSIVELVGGAAAAVVAGLAWRALWGHLSKARPQAEVVGDLRVP